MQGRQQVKQEICAIIVAVVADSLTCGSAAVF